MSEIKMPDPLTYSHVQGFIWLTFAHAADADFSEEEYQACVGRINAWRNPDEPATGAEVLEEVLTWYNSFPGARDTEEGLKDLWMARINTMLKCANILKENYSPDALDSFLKDVSSIIKADGKVTDTESKWFQMLSDQLKA